MGAATKTESRAWGDRINMTLNTLLIKDFHRDLELDLDKALSTIIGLKKKFGSELRVVSGASIDSKTGKPVSTLTVFRVHEVTLEETIRLETLREVRNLLCEKGVYALGDWLDKEVM